jgi:hypothetical protein
VKRPTWTTKGHPTSKVKKKEKGCRETSKKISKDISIPIQFFCSLYRKVLSPQA